MFKDKPVISNQHGALVMAFIPFIYALFSAPFTSLQLLFGFAWLFLYFFSYPFFANFSRKPTSRNWKWAGIYLGLSLIFGIPLLILKPALFEFVIYLIPLFFIQLYYAKKKDERNLNNDLAGILSFGIVGLASYYLATEQYAIAILIHPTLFFIATTLYIKSVARERKNPLYLKLSLYTHFVLGLLYFSLNFYFLTFAYFIAFLRAFIIPRKHFNVRQVGMIEFPIVLLFLICVILSPLF